MPAHTRTDEAGLGNDTGPLGNALGRLELEDAISLERAVDRIKHQPRRDPAAPDHYSGNAVNGSQVTLKLFEANRFHDVYCGQYTPDQETGPG